MEYKYYDEFDKIFLIHLVFKLTQQVYCLKNFIIVKYEYIKQLELS